jgi:UDP-N-acetylglucosamine 1-carboxyvinyltransferase
MSKYIIEGGIPLKGTVSVSGSKNAALPILCASLLTSEKVVLHNVPHIEDIESMVEILASLGARVRFRNRHTLEIENDQVHSGYVESAKACKMRASILLLGALLGRFHAVSVSYPGGCVLGKRPIDAHIKAFRRLGAKAVINNDRIDLVAKTLQGKKIIMSEISVTATENIIMAAVLAKGTTEVRLAAAEPHVADLCSFLVSMGAHIEGIGTHTLRIEGVSALHGTTYMITSDYLEAATLLLAGIITRGTVTVKNVFVDQLDAFFNKLDEVGVKYKIEGTDVMVFPTKRFRVPSRVESRTYPGFPTDLQAPFAVLLTQCEGVSKIFETLFEGRLNYLFELEKMRARVEILNPHQALVIGPSRLKGITVSSLDIRAGAAMVLAALIARGTTEINNVVYIDRGYENLEKKLRQLGAHIKRVK